MLLMQYPHVCGDSFEWKDLFQILMWLVDTDVDILWDHITWMKMIPGTNFKSVDVQGS
jgi:hypothetical protein